MFEGKKRTWDKSPVWPTKEIGEETDKEASNWKQFNEPFEPPVARKFWLGDTERQVIGPFCRLEWTWEGANKWEAAWVEEQETDKSVKEWGITVNEDGEEDKEYGIDEFVEGCGLTFTIPSQWSSLSFNEELKRVELSQKSWQTEEDNESLMTEGKVESTVR